MSASFEQVPTKYIVESPSNPRQHYDPVAMAELVESVKRHGIMQPIIVRPRQPKGFELVAGHRRVRAGREAGLEQIPALVRELSDVEVLELQVIENLQRADLHPLEEAEGYERLMALDQAQYANVDHLAAKIGKSRSYVYGRMKLLALQPEARKAFYAGKLDPSRALLLARIPVASLQLEALKEITESHWNGGDGMTYRQAADHIQRRFMLRLDQAPFKQGDADLVPAAGSCRTCPKRTGNERDLFGDVKGADVCTDPSCFETKRQAHLERLRTAVAESGQKLITGNEAKKIKPYSYGELAGGYVALDDTFYTETEGPGIERMTYRKAVGKSGIVPILMEDPHSGKVIEIARRADVAELAFERGVVIGKRSSAASSDDAKRKLKVKTANEFRRRLFDLVREVFNVHEISQHAIAYAHYQALTHLDQKRFCELRNWPRDEAMERFSQLEDDDLLLAQVEMAMTPEIGVSEYSIEAPPTTMIGFASSLGIDHEAIQQAVKTELRAKAREREQRKAAAEKAEAEADRRPPRQKRPGGNRRAKGEAAAAAAAVAATPESTVPPAPAAALPSDAWPFPVGAQRA